MSFGVFTLKATSRRLIIGAARLHIEAHGVMEMHSDNVVGMAELHSFCGWTVEDRRWGQKRLDD
jgi:hypothetical protein